MHFWLFFFSPLNQIFSYWSYPLEAFSLLNIQVLYWSIFAPACFNQHGQSIRNVFLYEPHNCRCLVYSSIWASTPMTSAHFCSSLRQAVLLICKLANEARLYVRLPAHSLWCCLGHCTEDRDPGGKAEQVRWGVLWPQGVWLSPSRSWKTPLSTEMFGFDCAVVTAGLGLISQVEIEWLVAPGWLTPSPKWNKYYLYVIGVISQPTLQHVEDLDSVFRAALVKLLKGSRQE